MAASGRKNRKASAVELTEKGPPSSRPSRYQPSSTLNTTTPHSRLERLNNRNRGIMSPPPSVAAFTLHPDAKHGRRPSADVSRRRSTKTNRIAMSDVSIGSRQQRQETLRRLSTAKLRADPVDSRRQIPLHSTANSSRRPPFRLGSITTPSSSFWSCELSPEVRKAHDVGGRRQQQDEEDSKMEEERRRRMVSQEQHSSPSWKSITNL